MGGVSELTCKLTNDSVVFFVGSGVSYSSNLPSADDILRSTCQKILPSLSEKEINLILKGQPEVVYAILLECSHQNVNCLDMWKCLSPTKWSEGYFPEANFEHCFIAAYSRRAKVPIFTVNYDTMFESACEKLGMKEGTDYAVVTEYDQINPSKDILYICKLHGDIGRIGDCIDPNTFKTTMAEITKKNRPWLDYLYQIMETKHICFAGYSGRDIDYYPFLKRQLNSGRACPSFWSLKNGKDKEGNVIRDIGWDNAIAITSGQMIELFPSEFFSDIYEVVFEAQCYANESEFRIGQSFREKLNAIHSTASMSSSNPSEEKQSFLAQIREEIQEVNLSEEIFLMRFLQLQGKNQESERVLQEQHLISRINEFEEWEQQLILLSKMTLAREHAKFLEYRKTAKAIRHIAQGKRKQAASQEERETARGQELNAWVQIISSHQMEIPSQLQFKLPLHMRGYGRLLVVKAGFCTLDVLVRLAGQIFCRTNIVTIQESRLRSYAINVGLVEKLCKSDMLIFRWFVKITVRKLERLREAAYEVGNYATVIGTMKYLARLIPKEDFGTEAKAFGALVSDLSAISILKRDSIKSEKEFQAALIEAKGNDNTLNIIKAYLKYACERIRNEEKPFPCKEYASELKDYMDKVESVSLQKCFAYIRETYLKPNLS